ncbi:Hypothetical protein SCF082_LOCUS3077, partial [Durusdinium trenchii]
SAQFPRPNDVPRHGAMVTSPYSLLTLAVLIPLAAASADHTALQHLDAGNSTEVVVPKLSHGPVFLKLKSAETAGSQKGDPDCYYIMGLSKFSWAFICDLLALVVILLCIPLLLSCSKRRPLGASMFEFKLFGDEPNPSLKTPFSTYHSFQMSH